MYPAHTLLSCSLTLMQAWFLHGKQTISFAAFAVICNRPHVCESSFLRNRSFSKDCRLKLLIMLWLTSLGRLFNVLAIWENVIENSCWQTNNLPFMCPSFVQWAKVLIKGKSVNFLYTLDLVSSSMLWHEPIFRPSNLDIILATSFSRTFLKRDMAFENLS